MNHHIKLFENSACTTLENVKLHYGAINKGNEAEIRWKYKHTNPQEAGASTVNKRYVTVAYMYAVVYLIVIEESNLFYGKISASYSIGNNLGLTWSREIYLISGK